MDIIDKKVNHSTDGVGTETAFYNPNLTLRISFNNKSPRSYKVPEDFDSGFISTGDPKFPEFIAACYSRILYLQGVNKCL